MRKAILILLFVAMQAHAQYINLEGGDVLRQGYCRYSKEAYNCLEIKKDGKVYHLLYDEKGELAIYLVEGDKAKFIWSRNSI